MLQCTELYKDRIDPVDLSTIVCYEDFERMLTPVFMLHTRPCSLTSDQVYRIVCAALSIPHVKVVDENFVLCHDVDDLLELAEGEGMSPNVKREGLVFKSNTSQFSFKAVSNSYLLKKG